MNRATDFHGWTRIGMIHQELTDKIIGVFYDVYNELGHGFLESVYQKAMVIAFQEKGMLFEQQIEIPVWFHNQRAGIFYADLLIENTVIIELKAVRTLDSSHEAQLLNYLRATNIEVGLLLNFGVRPEIKRRVYDNPRKQIRENPRSSVADPSEE
jgi:GxxExxY protein